MAAEAYESHGHEIEHGMSELVQPRMVYGRPSDTGIRTLDGVGLESRLLCDAKLESHDADGGVVGGAGI